MDKFKKWLNTAAKTLKHSIERFPEALVMAYLFGVTAILLNMADYDATTYRDNLEHLMLTFMLGVPLFLSFKTLHEYYLKEKWHRFALDAIAGLILIAFFFTIPEEINDVFMLRVLVVNVSLYMAFSLVPFFYAKEQYALYVLKLIADAAIALLYSIVLTIGFSAIYFALEELFGLNIDSDTYENTFILIYTWFAPTYFLGGLIKTSEDIGGFAYSQVFKILFIYIVMPLLTVYTAIIYAYFIRLLIDRSMPENTIGHLVIWYSAISLLVLFFTREQRETNAFSRAFHKFLPVVMLLPLAMMFYAIFVRISEYGLTVRRYFVVALGLWVLGNMLYLIFSKKRINQVIILSSIVIMLLSMYGPLGAYPVSLWQQNMRFEKLLTDLNMLEDGQIVPRDDLSKADQGRVNDFLNYFYWQHEFSDVKILPEGFETEDSQEVFGFEYDLYVRPINSRDYFNYWINNEEVTYDISGYKTYIRLNWYFEKPPGDTYELEISDQGDLKVQKEGVYLTTIPLGDWLKSQDNADQMLTADQASLEYSEGGKSFKVIIQNIYGELSEANDKVQIRSFDFILLTQ